MPKRESNGSMKFLCLIIFLSRAASFMALAQAPIGAPQALSPEFRVRVLPSKPAYRVSETLFTRAEFTNLTQGTLCFPPPPQDCGSCRLGSLNVSADLDQGESRDVFMCHVYDRGISREQFIQEIEQRWIRLAPNAVYTTGDFPSSLRLDTPGRWKLRADYVPPDLRSGGARGDRWDLQTVLEHFGCSMPSQSVTSDAVGISVVPANK